MNIETLIERLNAYSAEHQQHGGITAEAVDAISTLQTENEKLRNEVERQRRSADDRKHLYENAERAYMKVVAELEQVKRERDAAVERIREWEKFDTYLFVHNFITPEKWRGPGKEN